ncbi:hypothetical protein [Kribbella sp. NPDC048928]|uniref:hypothetical protein n=1 Tax=Kribbella sp. NPDC048928 TaxID=3364111 RepID=UPI003710903B
MTDADLDLLAYDIADAIDRGGYPLDLCQADVRAALPAFIARAQQNAAATDE